MNQDTTATMTPSADHYPSRNGRPARLVDRKDPVVYADAAKIPPIAQSDIDHYRQHGFMILDHFFEAKDIAQFQQELERLRHQPDAEHGPQVITEKNSHAVRSIFQIHQNSAVFKALANDKRLVAIAKYILDDDVYIHQSRLNYKPGFQGKEFYWHSDFETWHTEDGMPRMRALSMSITLTENFSHNGPLMLIPKSHLYYAICDGKTPKNHYLASLKQQQFGIPSEACISQLVDQGGIVSATGKAGSVIIFDCNTMHGSNGNITPQPRSNLFFVYNAVSNRVEAPFCQQAPRPEYICTRHLIEPVPSP